MKCRLQQAVRLGILIGLLVPGIISLSALPAAGGQERPTATAQRKVHLDLRSATLLEALRALFATHHIAYVIEPNAARLAAITHRSVHFSDVSVDLAIDRLLSSYGSKNEFSYRKAGRKYIVTLKNVTLNATQKTPTEALGELLIQTASDFIYPLDMQGDSFPPLPIANVPLDAAVRQLFAPRSAGQRTSDRVDFTVFDETFIVSSKEVSRFSTETVRRKIAFRFTNTPRRQAMEALLRSVDLNYVFLVDDQRRITASSQAMTFRSALELLLRGSGVTYRVHGGIYTFSPQEITGLVEP